MSLRAGDSMGVLTTRTRQIAWLALWALVLVLVVRFALFAWDAAVRPSHGFAAYYTSARILRDGTDLALAYDDDWFNVTIPLYGPQVGEIYQPNPPTAALILLPLSTLEYGPARVIWILLNCLALAGLAGWLVWRLGPKSIWAPATLAFGMVYQPLYANIKYGQAYLMLLVLMFVAWRGYRGGRAGVFGLALGAMMVFKTAGATLWAIPLAQRGWRPRGWAIAAVLAICLASLPWIGLGAWRTYGGLLPELGSGPWFSVTAYQTQTSLVRHLLTFDAQWNPAPWLDAPSLAAGLEGLGFVAVAGATLWAAWRARGGDLAFAALIIAGVGLSPLSEDYHYVLLLLPLGIVAQWARGRAGWVWVGVAVSAGLIAADLPYQSARLAGGVWALAAYPKLYGAWILWGLALWGIGRGDPFEELG